MDGVLCNRDSSEHNVTGSVSGFLKSASTRADQAALIHEGQAWSYAEVLEEARRWATRLRECVTSHPVQGVGIYVHTGAAEHVGKVAALLAGIAFVPLNPKFPAQRLAEMITQAGISIIIVDGGAAKELGDIFDLLKTKPTVFLPEGLSRPLRRRIGTPIVDAVDLAQASPLPLDEIAQPTAADVAYIMFTSGSSGQPKGVPVSHGSLMAYVDSAVRRYNFGHEDIFALTFDSTFDLSIFGPFMAWESGASAITMRPRDISSPVDFINENKVSVWLSVPSVAKTLVSDAALSPRSLPSLRYSLFCGEALPEYVATAWQQAAHNSALINMYGPTEATISVSEYTWNPASSPKQCVNGLVPIGHVYAGHHVAIVDEAGLDVAIGGRGELCIAGPQIFSGYLDSDRSSNCFLLRSELGEVRRYYKTGDICEVLGDGTIVYVARNDHQVKISGYRIELGDVEAALRKLGATDAVAVPWPPNDAKSIFAATTGSSVNIEAVEQVLPPYMVPQKIVNLDEMPLNVNGKIDRKGVVELLAESLRPTKVASSKLSLDDVKLLVAQALGEDPSNVSDDSHLHHPDSWDSLGHISVVVALETRLGTQIDPGHDHELRSIQGILAFAHGRTGSRQVNRSLRGLLVTETSIANSDVSNGSLSYCGYGLTDLLASSATFEQVSYLLLNRELPDGTQVLAFQQQLARRRAISPAAMEALRLCARVGAHPLSALVTAVSLLNAEISGVRGGLSVQSLGEVGEAGMDLIAQLPTLLSAYHMLRQGREPIAPEPEFPHVVNMLHMFGFPASERNIDAITRDFIIHADNGTTASTYACLVANSAHTTVHAAVAAAAGVFSGARHGYASETAYAQLARLDGPDAVKAYVERLLDDGTLVDGIGHAIYGRAGDPRLAPYRKVATQVALDEGNVNGLEKANAMYDAACSRRDGAQPNYDLFGGLLYESLGLPVDLSAPLHVCYRIVGWIAHILEERATGQPLVRPDARYVGHGSRLVVPPSDLSPLKGSEPA
ncbi:citrate/2-methylcitrate synthase [Streptomyces sp. NPDC102441]|uniref:citrate/2-methylcitrate synthase n=1 Tax=Streptomyces sp. NPDC102441 TaxID=3366176 RepID=UPI0038207047